MRLAVVLLALVGCKHSSTTDAAVGDALFRTIQCGAGTVTNCYARPPTVGIRLAGQVVVVKPLAAAVPVPYAQVNLVHDGRTVATTATDCDGNFRFRESLSEESYDVVLGPGDYEGSITVQLNGTTLKAPEVTLFAEPRPTASH